jgi:iron complex transport system substrate-binding protein
VVLATNQRSLRDIFNTIWLISPVAGQRKRAQRLVEAMRREIWGRPRWHKHAPTAEGYVEEWDEPLISGIRWI